MFRSGLREPSHRGDAGGSAPTAIILAAFVGTGIGAALPGAMLPLLLVRWSLSDTQAGTLFFLFFVGSASGALLSRGLLSRSILRGCATTALGAVLLALASRSTAFAAITIYGVGLGITMTSGSLLQSRRYPVNRVSQMARLNLALVDRSLPGPIDCATRRGGTKSAGDAVCIVRVLSAHCSSGVPMGAKCERRSQRRIGLTKHRFPPTLRGALS